MSGLEGSLRRIQHWLDVQGVTAAVVGGLAVSARVEPRFTRDVDLCVAVTDDREAEELVHRLRSDGYEIHALVEQEATGRIATVRLSEGRAEDGPIVDILFASSGVEPEVVHSAESMELFVGLHALVATVGALIALKLLARDDRYRPQDGVDLIRLIGIATPTDLTQARALVRSIEERGYARGRDLTGALEDLVRSYRD
ncbi:MAG: nucleotidyl transferase AbiEii/AbiGii toxin family protein [Chloroflexi bacterium]|nr:nucleotidyl transferase AbiEii/AbiGii toxin family protein [Chloroflexota bacterium]